MRIGLIGLPNSGKTTIFNALTKLEAPVTAYTNAKTEPNLAVVEVADDRICRLSEMYRPKKTIYTTIEFIDFVGVTEGSAKDGLFSVPGWQYPEYPVQCLTLEPISKRPLLPNICVRLKF